MKVFLSSFLVLLTLLAVTTAQRDRNEARDDDVYFPLSRRQIFRQRQDDHDRRRDSAATHLDKETNVGVNIPGIYEMGLLSGGNRGTGSRGTGLGINVLGGLVRVNLNRNRDPTTGRRRGPISVQVGGSDVYKQDD